MKLSSAINARRTFVLFVSLLMFSFSNSFSQGDLQFNQVKLIGNTQETVPSGKVWKIESAFGQGSPVPICMLCRSTCDWSYTGYISSGFYVNGSLCIEDVLLASPTSGWTSTNCTGGAWSGSATKCLRGYTVNPFPIWLPANATVKAAVSGAYLSVVEFNIVP